jgi:hypothetical protein
MGEAPNGAGNVHGADRTGVLSTPQHTISTDQRYRGYDYAQLEAMTLEALTSLGLVRMQDGIYKFSIAENGTITLVPLPKPEPKPQLPAVTDPVAQAVVSDITMEVLAVVKKVALDPIIHLCYSFGVNNGLFKGDLGDYLSYCVRFTSEKGFGYRPVIETGLPSLLEILRRQQGQGSGGGYVPI